MIAAAALVTAVVLLAVPAVGRRTARLRLIRVVSGAPSDEPSRDGPPSDEPSRDGPPRDGPPRDGPSRDGSRDGPRRDGLAPDGPPRNDRSAGGDRRTRLLLGAATALAVAGLIGTAWGVPVGAAVGVGVQRLLRRREPPWLRQQREAAAADLPLGADLLAAALRAGAPVDAAAQAVADALGGPLGERLMRTARALRLGAGPAEAWAHLSEVTGADRLVAAAIRSSASGGALAGALGRVADDLRADRAVVAAAAAQRAGVLIVLPLGLCFLPAFLLAGLVPVLIAVLGDVL